MLARVAGLIAVLSGLAPCASIVIPAGPAIRAPIIADADLITRDGARLPLAVWPSKTPKAVVIALHSFRDYRQAYDELGRWFATRNVSVYAYDQRGFGGSPNRGLWAGNKTMVNDLRDAILAVRATNVGANIYLAGESMGAAVIMALMASTDPPSISGIVLAAPAVRGRLVRTPFGDALLSLAKFAVPGSATRVERQQDPALSAIALARLRDDPLVLREVRVDTYSGLMALADAAFAAAPGIDVPTLLLFGANDGSVTRTAVCDAQARIPRALLSSVFYVDGPHLLLQMADNKRAFADIDAWMSGAPPPSNSDANIAADLARLCRARRAAR